MCGCGNRAGSQRSNILAVCFNAHARTKLLIAEFAVSEIKCHRSVTVVHPELRRSPIMITWNSLVIASSSNSLNRTVHG
jgi:hypothetical protein